MSMFRRSLSLGVLVLLGAAHSGLAVIMHDAAQSDPSWQQQYTDLGCQYGSVVGLGGYNGTSWQNIGSGVVISDHCVIGAAHSALFNNGGLFSNYVAVTGNNLVSDYWGTYTTTNVTVSPLHEEIGSTDLAIWTFADNITSSKVTAATLHAGSDSALIGSVVDFVGFGYTGYASVGAVGNLDGQKRGCQNVLEQLGLPAAGFGTDQLITRFVAPGNPGYQHLGGRGANYDSGGGWFVNGELVAINEWGAVSFGYGFPNGATSISQNLGWINSVTGLPEPGTLLLLGVAAVFPLRRRRVS